MFQNHWHPISHILEGHSDLVRCCAYSYDGKLLASLSFDGTIRLWDTSSGKTQHTIKAFHKHYKITMALSSTGFIAASNKTTVKMWSLYTGEQLLLPVEKYSRDEPGAIGDIKFSNDGNMLAAAVGRDIVIWHIPDYKLLLRQENAFSDDTVRFIKFSKTDTLIGSVAKQTITIWSLESDVIGDNMNGEDHNSEASIQHNLKLKRQKDLIIPISHKSHACGIAFSPDSKYVATGANKPNKVYIWDWKSGTLPVDLTGHMGGISTVEFSPDGLFLASASYDGTIRMWREPWVAKQPPLVLTGHLRGVYDLAFSPSDTCLATCSGDKTVRIWDYGSYKAQVQSEADTKQSQSNPHAGPISHIALSEDGKWVASASIVGLVCLWDGNSGIFQRSLGGHTRHIISLAFSHDSRKLISTYDDGPVRIWSLEDDFKLRTLLGHQDVVRCAVLSRDGTLLASGCDDTTIRVWDLTRPEVGHTMSTQEEEGEIGEIVELNGAQGVRVFYGHSHFVLCVLFSQDGRYLVSGAGYGEIMVWDLHTGHQTGSSIHATTIKEKCKVRMNAMAFSADEKRLIASDAKGISIWDITRENGSMRFEYLLKSETRSAIHSLSVNIDHPQYVITERGPILIRELRDGARARIKSELWCPYIVTSDTETWITWCGKKVILLPDRYLPEHGEENYTIKAHKDRVVVGCRTGEVLIFRFKKNANWLDVL